MKVLIVGDRLFIGNAMVVAARAAGHEIIADDSLSMHRAHAPYIGALVNEHKPDVIVNCISELVSDTKPVMSMLTANILLPHALAAAAQNADLASSAAAVGCHVFQISTPHVFDGLLEIPWQYTAHHRTNATDYFGRSRALGEVVDRHVTVVRCDAISPEAGYVRRTLLTAGEGRSVVGWTRVWWNGGFADDIAERVVGLFGQGAAAQERIVHIAMKDGLSRYALARGLLATAGVSRAVEESPTFVYNRMLAPTPGLELPPIEAALEAHRERLVKNACHSIAHIQ